MEPTQIPYLSVNEHHSGWANHHFLCAFFGSTISFIVGLFFQPAMLLDCRGGHFWKLSSNTKNAAQLLVYPLRSLVATEKLHAFIGSPESPQLMCSIRIGKQGLAAKNNKKNHRGGSNGGFRRRWRKSPRGFFRGRCCFDRGNQGPVWMGTTLDGCGGNCNACRRAHVWEHHFLTSGGME